MKTMQDYTNYCSSEQTRRAYKLGAPITQQNPHLNLLGTPITEIGTTYDEFGKKIGKYYNNPTTQQLINWLREEKGVEIQINSYTIKSLGYKGYIYANVAYNTLNYNTYNQAELAAIDAALGYLEREVRGETRL